MLICKSGPLCPPGAPPARFFGVFLILLEGGKGDLGGFKLCFQPGSPLGKNIFIFESAGLVVFIIFFPPRPQKNRKKKLKKKK